MNIFVVIREILYDFIVTIIYVFMNTISFPKVIEQLYNLIKKKLNNIIQTLNHI